MNDVSRETPPWPAEAEGVFAVERLPLAAAYAASLADDGVVRGLIGPREVPRLWERHLLNCALMAEVVPEGSTVCDIGSGAGLPGLVLAIARPDLRVTLVEPLLRRTTYLEEISATLALDNVVVVRGRAEDLHGKGRFDLVTSRAVAPLERLLRWSMPLVAPHGAMVAMKGASVADEIVESRAVWTELGCGEPEVVTVGDPASSTATLVRVAFADPQRVSSTFAARSRGTGRRGSFSRPNRRQRP